MDDLEFRRRVYADPGTTDEEVIEATKEDPSRLTFLEDIRSFDQKLTKALDVPVPDNLAERLILRQSIEEHQQRKRQTRIHLALAASIAFVFGLTFNFLGSSPQRDLGQYTLEHFYHEAHYIDHIGESTTLDQLNAKLASYGGALKKSVGNVIFANNCDYGGVKSLHLVFEDADGHITVFVTEKDGHNMKFVESFKDKDMSGFGMKYKNAEVMLVGKKQEQLKAFAKKIDNNLNWEI